MTKQLERDQLTSLSTQPSSAHTAFKLPSTHTHKMNTCSCLACILAAHTVPHPLQFREQRRSRRLAAKPRISYREAPEPSRQSQEKQDKTYRLIGMTFAEFAASIRGEGLNYIEANYEAGQRLKDLAADVDEATYQANIEARAAERLRVRAERVRVRAEAAVARQDATLRRRSQQIVNRIERDAAILASVAHSAEQSLLLSMPSTPPRLQRQDAVTGEAPWAPLHGPALTRTEATGCELPPEPNWIPFEWTETNLPPPPPLRRVCASPDCDEDCKRCRYNDRLAEHNRNRPLPTGPAFVPNMINPALPPPPIGATIVRIPIDMRLMTDAALREIIAAASTALVSR